MSKAMPNGSRTISPPVKQHGNGYGLLLLVFNFILTGVFWWQLPPQIPLFYSLSYGVNQLVAREWFFILPVGSLFIWLSYFFLARWKVSLSIYTDIIKWLHVLCLFLFSLAIVHILWILL